MSQKQPNPPPKRSRRALGLGQKKSERGPETAVGRPVEDAECRVCDEVGCTVHNLHAHFNQLTPAEAERLSWLAEECAEVVVVIEKIKRHGFESYDPYDSSRTSNRQTLADEMGHVRAAMLLLWQSGDVVKAQVHSRASYKLGTVSRWMHHQALELLHATLEGSK